MQPFFLDTSALVKRYAAETGSKWIFRLLRPSAGNIVFVVCITGAETVAALARKRKGKHLTAADAAKAISRFERHFARRYQKISVTNDLIRAAMSYADKHELRGYDAVQLAAAMEIEAERKLIGASPLTLVTADTDLYNAAQNEGLLVDNPNLHP